MKKYSFKWEDFLQLVLLCIGTYVYMEHQNWLHKGTQFLKRKFFPKKDD